MVETASQEARKRLKRALKEKGSNKLDDVGGLNRSAMTSCERVFASRLFQIESSL